MSTSTKPGISSMARRVCAVALLFTVIILIVGCNPYTGKKNPDPVQDSNIVRDSSIDLKHFYDEFGLDGTFLLADGETYRVYNPDLSHVKETPASTFNIVTALIALEEGICKDENSLIKWNGMISNSPEANKDISLQYAFQRNIDWGMWELRKKIGAEKMRDWLKKMQYGYKELPQGIDSNTTTNGKTSMFWVVDPVIHTNPSLQLEFIKRLYYDSLPFSKRSMQILRKLLYQKDIGGFGVYGKRGSYRLNTEEKYIGWFIGWAERAGAVYFFVNYLQTANLEHPKIVDAQKEIVYNIFERGNVLK